jgi:hypothetical protein
MIVAFWGRKKTYLAGELFDGHVKNVDLVQIASIHTDKLVMKGEVKVPRVLDLDIPLCP